MYSEDGGTTWKNKKGEILGLPIKPNEIEPTVLIKSGYNLINQSGSFIDSDFIFRIVYYADDEAGIPQIYLTSFDLKKPLLLNVEKVTSLNFDFHLKGTGTLSLPISRPEIFQIDNNIEILYRELNDIILLKRPSNDGQDSWQRNSLYNGYIKNWEPVIDTNLLLENKLSIFIQGAEQEERDQIYAGDNSVPIFILNNF